MPEPNVDLLRALLPDPGTDVAQLFRDEDRFATTAEAVAELFDPAVESVPAWRGAGTTYSGIDGFREMWLDWLEPWASYHVHVDEMFDVGDSVVVLVRDRARRHGMDVEVELISGSLWTFGNGRKGGARRTVRLILLSSDLRDHGRHGQQAQEGNHRGGGSCRARRGWHRDRRKRGL